MFNEKRFALARRRRGMTKKMLAERVGVSERSITGYESGTQEPETPTIRKISDALRFPEAFFLGDVPELLTPDAASFRSLSKMSAKQRDSALGAGSIALMLNDWIESKFDLPIPDVPDLGRDHVALDADLGDSSSIDSSDDYPSHTGSQDPEAAAETLRAHWGLGELPVKNMIALLESKGIRVYSLAIDAKEVDAFSVWNGGKPFVFLNTYKSAEHCRFDAAHELGHLVLHKHGQTQGPELEREANAFASAFLMPRGSVLANSPRVATLPALIKHKKYWSVSVAALNYRLHSLGLTTDWAYRTLCIQLAEAGFRKSEPEGVPHERSLLLEKVFSVLRQEGTTKASVASQLDIEPNEINELTFGLMLNVLSGGGSTTKPSSSKKARLRLV
ncbi:MULTISPECIES: helix-turn-helix domain-containing protein [unclassified Rhodanobacter]|uniref:Helix-turn-helix domain-containing protein n=1 Tax=Rhodanobacter humi TaxID=1888173 RepID=A0ABV4ANQ4_9GAMM